MNDLRFCVRTVVGLQWKAVCNGTPLTVEKISASSGAKASDS